MMEILLLIGLLALTVWAFTNSLLWGCLVLLGVCLYYYFRRYATFCIMMAMRCYGKEDIKGCFRWFERGAKRGYDTNQKITYAYYLLREGRIERSEAIFNSVLAFRLDPKTKYLAKSNHAILLLKTGRKQEALEELEEIFPYFKNTTIYGSLGYLYIVTGQLEKAKEFNLEAYDYNKENAVILDNMVQLYAELGDYEEAYRYACELMEQKPAFIEAYYDAAVVEKQLSKTEEAKEHLEHALTIRTTYISTISHEDAQKLLDSLL